MPLNVYYLVLIDDYCEVVTITWNVDESLGTS